MSYRGDETCRAKVGLLFLRDCNRPMRKNCKECNRPVCSQHTVRIDDKVYCPECAAKNKKAKVNDANVKRVRNRHQHHANYSYVPFYYGHSHYYSDMDYHTFDDQEIVDYSDMDNDFGDDAFDDDGMES